MKAKRGQPKAKRKQSEELVELVACEVAPATLENMAPVSVVQEATMQEAIVQESTVQLSTIQEPSTETGAAKPCKKTKQALQREGEADQIAARLTKALVEHLKDLEGDKVIEEALNRLAQYESAESLKQMALTDPIERATWRDIARLGRLDPSLVSTFMSRVDKQALREQVSGARGAHAVSSLDDTPLGQARYLALHDDLSKEWQPRNGIEWTYIEQMTVAQTQFLFWMEKFTIRSLMQSRPTTPGPWEPPRVSEAKAIEDALNTADRFQRMFLRAQRALRDMRRYTVNIQHAEQVNMAEQQVNVAGDMHSNASARSEEEKVKEIL
jgi:hypothetical protein